MSLKPHIRITPDGPYVVTGDVPLYEDAIVPNEWEGHNEYHRVRQVETPEDEYHLCRCGKSHDKPFCDGSHERLGFYGEEVASREPYRDRADVFPGPEVYLFDDNRCAYARMCHRAQGDVWTLTENSVNDEIKDEAVAASWNCPTGRLVSVDTRNREVYEQDFEPSIVMLEDVQERASGPLFVRGGIPLESADGSEYERHNRYALCRCGRSSNRPFCDASHINLGFDDGSVALRGQWEGIDDSFQDSPVD